MPKKKPAVVVTRRLPEAVEARMTELFDTRLRPDDRPMSEAELVEAVRTADVLVPTVTDRIGRKVIAAAGPQLELIASFSTGVDHIDLAAAQERGIMVTNTPGVLTEDTADMTMALILAVPRRLAEGAHLLTDRKGEWAGWSPTWMLGHRIWGKRLGIVGMGRIGTAVARRAKAFGLSIHYTIAIASARRPRRRWRRPTGTASTRCWRASTSSRSIARPRLRPTICSRRAGWR